MTARYDRAPSVELLRQLEEGGLLAPLRRRWSVADVPLDLQFREHDEVHLYCGLTRLVSARRRAAGVRIDAHPTYKNQPCANGLFRRWSEGEHGFGEALAEYLGRVVVAPQHVLKEGAVQAAWMAVQEPWVTLDREAVIGRDSSASRDAALDAAEVQAAFDAIDVLAVAEGWRRPAPPKSANELDQLAIDAEGRLVLVELKDARSGEVAVAPLQALRYAWEWHNAIGGLLVPLGKVLDARRKVGLVPGHVGSLNGKLRVAVAWGQGSPSTEVQRRLRETKRIADANLPSGITEIEVWALPEAGPERIL